MERRTFFLRWALCAVTAVVMSMIGVKLGAIGWIHRADPTGITLLICALGYLTSGWLGMQYWNISRVSATSSVLLIITGALRHGRYISGVCRDLGLLGTIIGFVKILPNFANFDVTQQDQMVNLIRSVGVNLGTAFVTTLGGIVASIIIDIQCHALQARGASEDPHE